MDDKKGIIGSFLIGLIVVLFLTLLYLYSDIFLSVLVCFIVIFSYLGYKLFKGINGYKEYFYIFDISFLLMFLLFFIFIPICILYKNDIIIDYNNFISVYNYSFKEDIMFNLVIGFVSFIVGYFICFIRIKKDIANSGDLYDKNLEDVREEFLSCEYIEKNDNNVLDLDSLKSSFIIKEIDGKYYYVKKFDNEFFKYFILVLKTLFIVIVIVLLAILLLGL